MPQEIEKPAASPRAGGYKIGDEVTMYDRTFKVSGFRADGSPILEMKDVPGPGSAEFSYQGSVDNLPSTSLAAPEKKKPSTPMTMDRIMAKRDKIAALPPEVQKTVIDRLFDKVFGPKISKFNDQEKGRIRTNFENSILGKPLETSDFPTTEADYKRTGVSTGLGKRFSGSVMTGLSNLNEFLKKFESVAAGGHALRPGVWSGATGDVKKDIAKSEAERKHLSETAKVMMAESQPYAERHPFKAGTAELIGQSLPAAPIGMGVGELIPAVSSTAPLLAKVLGGAARGGVIGGAEGPAFFSPDIKGIEKGAKVGAIGGGAFPLFGASLKKLFGKGSGLLSKAGNLKPTAGAAADELVGSVDSLNKIAQDKFGKAIKDLTPEQKIEAVNAWRDETVKLQKAERLAAKTAAEQEKVTKAAEKAQAKVTKAVATIDARVATRRAMDEARALQKEISTFVKANKRAPNEEELTALRQQAKNKMTAPTTPAGPPAAAVTPPAPAAAVSREAGLAARKGESVIPERGKEFKTSEADRRSMPRSLKAQLFTSELSQIRKEITEAATPEEKTYHEQRLILKQEEAKRAMEVSIPDQFKVESPDAIKAVSAVADVTKVVDAPVSVTGGAPNVTVIPEGASGLTPAQQELNQKLDDALTRLSEATDPKVKAAVQKTVDNIKAAISSNDPSALQRISDAERKALDRKASAALTSSLGSGRAGTSAAELVSDVRLTPEQELEKLEESFYDLTDKLEAAGDQGKTLAKNLNILWKKPPKGSSRQEIVAAGEKALATITGAK